MRAYDSLFPKQRTEEPRAFLTLRGLPEPPSLPFPSLPDGMYRFGCVSSALGDRKGQSATNGGKRPLHETQVVGCWCSYRLQGI